MGSPRAHGLNVEVSVEGISHGAGCGGWEGQSQGLGESWGGRVDNGTCGVGRGRVVESVYASVYVLLPPEGPKAGSSVIGRDGDEAERPSEGMALGEQAVLHTL